ncbi:MAG: hypothetical protein WC861_06145 [Candidatus Micrarchaeia archaeon]
MISMLQFQVEAKAGVKASKTAAKPLSEVQIKRLEADKMEARDFLLKRLENLEDKLNSLKIKLGRSKMNDVSILDISEKKAEMMAAFKEYAEGRRASKDNAAMAVNLGEYDERKSFIKDAFVSYGSIFSQQKAFNFEESAAQYLAIIDYFKDVLPKDFKPADVVHPYVRKRAEF